MNRLSLAVCTALGSVMLAAAAVAQAPEPVRTQEQVRAESRIYGEQLMSVEERNRYREQYQVLQTKKERKQFRKEHRKLMQERARQQGATLSKDGLISQGGDQLKDRDRDRDRDQDRDRDRVHQPDRTNSPMPQPAPQPNRGGGGRGG